jgi:membrane-associated phospholipid phosphatase
VAASKSNNSADDVLDARYSWRVACNEREFVSMNPTSGRAFPHRSRAAGSQIAIAAAALGSMALLARALRDKNPPTIDRRARRIAQSRPMRRADRVLSPLFPLGLPGGYITIAYLTARALHRRGQRGGPAIVTSAWLGWLVHRTAKLVFVRERPRRRGVKRRTDSYPSGHTTGATALALTTAYVLHRRDLISFPHAIAIATIAPTTMGAYRVISDEHWATDVVGGWLLGGAVGLACNAVLADALGGAARQIKGPGARPRALYRHGRQERPMFSGEVGRVDFPDVRAGTARPFGR